MSAAVAARIENRHDVRMLQLGGCLRLAQEASSGFRLLQHRRLGNLQRYLAIQDRVVRPIHRSERPGAELRKDSEPSDSLGKAAGVVKGFRSPRARLTGGGNSGFG